MPGSVLTVAASGPPGLWVSDRRLVRLMALPDREFLLEL